MMIKLLYFAQIAEKTGYNSENISFEGSTTDELLQFLKEKYPDLEGMTFKLAVDQTLIQENTTIKNGDEIALLPPFAGG